MRRGLVLAFLRASRSIGLFRLARHLTADRLRILCYHGFSMLDEARFRSSLFMTREVFEARMRYLADKGYAVLPLPQALTDLERGMLPASAVAVTIDDGFHGVYRIASDILHRHGFPATLYLTTYYFQKQVPIYRLLVAYILWKAPTGLQVDLRHLGIPGLASGSTIVLTAAEKGRLRSLLIAYGEALGDEAERQSIARGLASAVGVDYETIRSTRILGLIDAQEAKELQEAGIDIQLHSHRHRFPIEPEAAKRELADNSRVIESVLGKTSRHFCYPDGDWSPEQWPALERFGVRSATTCDAGLAVRGGNRLALPRIMDDMRVAQIEFEAEVSGYMDLIRDLRARFTTSRPGRPA